MSHVPRARPLSKPSLSPPWQPECAPCLPPPQSRWGQSSQAGSPWPRTPIQAIPSRSGELICMKVTTGVPRSWCF